MSIWLSSAAVPAKLFSPLTKRKGTGRLNRWEACSTNLYRGGAIGNLAQLRGRRVAIGESGSGVPNLLMKLFHANGVEPSSMKLSRDEPPAAVAALLKGRIDAVVLASAPESPLVQMLLRTPEVRLLDFSQAEAYSRKFPFLSPVVLPRGMVDFARDLAVQ